MVDSLPHPGCQGIRMIDGDYPAMGVI